MKLIAEFDGLCEPKNPGGIAVAAWQVRAAGEIIASDARVVAQGEGATNNFAEYCALLGVLECLLSLPLDGEDSVELCGDSKVVVEQVNGHWNCNAASLKPLRERCRALLARFAVPIRLSWIPRRENQEADALGRAEYYRVSSAMSSPK